MNKNTARPEITDEDWNFTRVSNNELVACLLWEFLRESPTAHHLAEDWVKWSESRNPLVQKAEAAWQRAMQLEKDPANYPKAAEEADEAAKAAAAVNDAVSDAEYEKLYARQSAITININHRLNIPEYVARHFRGAFGGRELPAGLAWQKLDRQRRKELTEVCENVNAAVFISNEPRHSDKLAVDARARPEHWDPDATSFPDSRTLLDADSWGEGLEAFCINVDWARYDNETILDEFNKLATEIIKTRPKGYTPQNRKGSGLQRKTEWRGMLNSLGLARLGGRYTAGELKKHMPLCYDQITKPLSDKGTTAVQKSLDGARRRFLKRFHEILPFEQEPPLCLRRPSLPQ